MKTNLQRAHENLSNLYTIKEFAKKYPTFSESVLRSIYANVKKGEKEFINAFFIIDGKILVHEEIFFNIIENSKGGIYENS